MMGVLKPRSLEKQSFHCTNKTENIGRAFRAEETV